MNITYNKYLLCVAHPNHEDALLVVSKLDERNTIAPGVGDIIFLESNGESFNTAYEVCNVGHVFVDGLSKHVILMLEEIHEYQGRVINPQENDDYPFKVID